MPALLTEIATVEYSPDDDVPQTEEQRTVEQVVDAPAAKPLAELVSAQQRVIDTSAGKSFGEATSVQQRSVEQVAVVPAGRSPLETE